MNVSQPGNMQAWVVHEPGPIEAGPMRYGTKPIPSPQPGELLVQIRTTAAESAAAGLNEVGSVSSLCALCASVVNPRSPSYGIASISGSTHLRRASSENSTSAE